MMGVILSAYLSLPMFVFCFVHPLSLPPLSSALPQHQHDWLWVTPLSIFPYPPPPHAFLTPSRLPTPNATVINNNDRWRRRGHCRRQRLGGVGGGRCIGTGQRRRRRRNRFRRKKSRRRVGSGDFVGTARAVGGGGSQRRECSRRRKRWCWWRGCGRRFGFSGGLGGRARVFHAHVER